MCGILGFLTDQPSEENYKLLGDLLNISADRGTDATGIAIVEDKKIRVIKEDMPSDKFIKKHYIGLKKEISKASIVIGHTRLATQGHQRDNNNNHPIIGKKYVMVHNGTCSSMTRVTGYPYKGTVDSEVLLSYVEERGMKKGLEELQGSAAIALIKEGDPLTVHLWRHNNPLWIAYDPNKKTIFFASTEDILKEGLSNLLNFFSSFHIRQSEEHFLYKVTCHPLDIRIVDEIEPKSKYVFSYRKTPAVDHTDYEYGYGWDGFGTTYTGDESECSEHTPMNSDTPKDVSNVVDKDSPNFAEFSIVYKAAMKCRWDSVNKVYTTDPLPPVPLHSRFYFDGSSMDFENWSRLEGGGHVSIDKKLVKFFDKDKKSHFLMTVSGAIREGLIDLSK
jgi:predicted glutamine amidotransferase